MKCPLCMGFFGKHLYTVQRKRGFTKTLLTWLPKKYKGYFGFLFFSILKSIALKEDRKSATQIKSTSKYMSQLVNLLPLRRVEMYWTIIYLDENRPLFFFLFENPQFWDTIFLYDFLENCHIIIHFEKTPKWAERKKKCMMYYFLFFFYFLDQSIFAPHPLPN